MKLTKKQNKQIEELKNELSSAYQEEAIDGVLDIAELYRNPQEFCDDVCATYRDILYAAGYRDYSGKNSIYKGFELFGDECSLQEVARAVYYIAQPNKTPRAHFNKIVKEATKINDQLRALQQKAQQVADMCKEHADDFDFNDWEFDLNELNNRLEDLAGFDLEDAIPEPNSVEY